MAGVTVPVKIEGPAVCHTCHGSGAAPGTQPEVCPDCGGVGQISVNQGFFQLAQTCPHCKGTGRIITTPCPTCKGTGAERRTRTVKVKIPAGVKDGARIKIRGKGEPGPAGSPAGDLYVRVQVQQHPLFGRKGDDLTLEVPVSYRRGGARRERAGADAQRARDAEGAGRHPDRQDVPGARQGGAEAKRHTATCWSR